jgi:hypothetical protein
MKTMDGCFPNVMQVCRRGHVITDLLSTHPERGLSHCDRCGAATLDRCPTCGHPLPGATYVPGLVTLGTLTRPERCSACGAAFPWADRPPDAAPAEPLAVLEAMLRRLPRSIRRLRTRHADRPPFRVQDEYDLADLLRALLPLHFDVVRSESRTPSYAASTRSDFRLGQEAGACPIALTVKMTSPKTGEAHLLEQWREDVAYYEQVRDCETLVGFVYDPEGLLRQPRQRETVWSGHPGAVELRCVMAS